MLELATARALLNERQPYVEPIDRRQNCRRDFLEALNRVRRVRDYIPLPADFVRFAGPAQALITSSGSPLQVALIAILSPLAVAPTGASSTRNNRRYRGTAM